MYELNKHQKEVVDSDAKNIVVVAGAGTGKTHTLISRICKLVEGGVDPSSMLVLTFTRAAAQEFESRYRLANTAVQSPYFGTFHAFCYSLIYNNLKIREYLGLNTKLAPTVIDDVIENSIIEEIVATTHINLPKKALKYSYTPKLKEKFQYKIFKKAFKAFLIEKNFITYDMMSYEICKLFKDKSELILPYLSKYRYVFVDEFQDTDKNEWEFVKSFEGLSNIMVIGDIRQSLYAFRGADSSIMKSLLKNKEWEVIPLGKNYRSTIPICEYANEILDHYSDNVKSVELISDTYGVDVEEIRRNEFYRRLNTINKTEYDSVAILARTNHEVENLKANLKSNGIDFKYKKKKDISIYMAALDDKYVEEFLMSNLTVAELSFMMSMKHIEGDSFNARKYLEDKFKNTMHEIYKLRQSDNFGELQMLYANGDLKLEDIDNHISNESTKLYVGTIHSVKGLEFDEVYVTGVQSSKFRLDSEEALNLFYVACTRAKKHLVVCRS